MEKRDRYSFQTAADNPKLNDLKQPIVRAVWPEFMLHDPVADRCWAEMERYFPEFQVFLFVNGVMAGFANTVPFRWTRPLKDLPDRGWDWMLEEGVRGRKAGKDPDCLGGLQVCVDPAYQGRGLSALIVSEVKRTAIRSGFERLLIPVRPVLKHLYPLVPMSRYLGWRTAGNLPFDPWVRTHVRLGGRIVKVCPRSMDIRATVKKWSAWTGLSFPERGDYVVRGALCPVRIDPGHDRGAYVEANVWTAYGLKRG
jgi:GNAT superfamily N-acetyltransferase